MLEIPNRSQKVQRVCLLILVILVWYWNAKNKDLSHQVVKMERVTYFFFFFNVFNHRNWIAFFNIQCIQKIMNNLFNLWTFWLLSQRQLFIYYLFMLAVTSLVITHIKVTCQFLHDTAWVQSHFYVPPGNRTRNIRRSKLVCKHWATDTGLIKYKWWAQP